ncbi:MAG: poly(A) polymerase, partial [Psychrobacter alimentarius]
LPLLFESGAIDSLIIYPPSEPSALVKQVAINTDKRIAAGKSINPAFFYAALLWENYLHQLAKAKKRNMPFAEAQMHAAGKVIDRQRIKTAIPKFAEQFIRDIWILQPKLAAPRSKQIVQLSEHPRFRAGFDFLLLREQCGDAEHPLSESTNEMGEWWQTYQTLSERDQQQAIDAFDENIRRGAYKQGQGQRGRGRNRQKPESNTVEVSATNQPNPKHSKATGSTRTDVNEQTMVNDPANVPSRRRRATSQSSSAKQSGGHHDKGYDTQQATQDSSELAQLQQLSLANSSSQAVKRHQVSPKPLFVIEHEKVVPPLKRQLASDEKVNPVTAVTVQKKSVANRAPTEKAPQPKTEQAEVKDTSAKTAAKVTRSVATSPALVSMNNEPIPHKRRRRQPSVEVSHP